MGESTDLTLQGESHVAIAGDWHANTKWIEQAIPAIARETSDVRTILHLGDFGISSSSRGRKYLDSVDHWCERAGIERVLVTPGNHEDWDWLDSDFEAMPGEPIPISTTVAVLPRAFRFTLARRSFMSFGGAASVDYQQRRAGLDWFLTEAPTDDDVADAISGGPVDVLLMHETINGGDRGIRAPAASKPTGVASRGSALLCAQQREGNSGLVCRRAAFDASRPHARLRRANLR